MKVKVYRIEGRSGESLHVGSGSIGHLLPYDVDTHLTPSEDGISIVPRGYVFGFASISKLSDWFPLASREIICNSDRFKLSEYEVAGELVVWGRSQLVFDESRAKFLRELCLKCLAPVQLET